MMFVFLFACAPDDFVADDTAATDTETVDDTATTEPTGPGSLEGAWRSEGEDVSDLLAGDPLNFVRIDADFEGDSTYGVSFTDADGGSGTFTGTWTADTRTTPGSVILEQATPTVATARGIWQVSGDVLTYEVVQTAPDYGFVPPTPETGFGSTSGQGIESGVNVQVFRRRDE